MKACVALAGRLVLVAGLLQASFALAEDEPLRSLIDRQLTPAAGLQPGRCNDAEFLRRVSLDLVGMPPTASEAREFIANEVADKRERLVDRLLAMPQHARHLTAILDVMLMERRPNTHVSADEWEAWLLKSVCENKSWNALAREIMAADGDDPEQRPAARFALDRASDPHAVARDIGRVFFGRDMQCAQCHNHPMVDEYLQSDYHGLLAFVSPSYALVHTGGGTQKTLQAEKAGSDLAFESVFVGVPRRTGARMPGSVMIDEPFFLPGDEYQVLPADNVKAVPKFSRRQKLAELATNGSNAEFNQNIVNRLWALMFGRGLVHPLDMHHPDNPPTHPELLRLLGQQFAAMNFDIRGFLREVALTSAYQRSFDLPAGWLAASAQAAQDAEKLEKQRNSLEQASSASSESYDEALNEWEEAESTLLPVAEQLDKARNQYTDAKNKFDEATKAVAEAKTQLQAKRSISRPIELAAAAIAEASSDLPGDAQLTEMADKLTARSGQLTSELAALSKSFEEKTTAVGPAAAALGSATPKVGTALATAMPLNAAMIRAEQSMLAARNRAAADAEALAALDQNVITARDFAQIAEFHKALVAASEVVSNRNAEFATAQKNVDEFAPIVAEREAVVKKATEALAAAGTNGAIRLNAAGTGAFVSATAAQPMLAGVAEASSGDALAEALKSRAAAVAEQEARAKALADASAALAAAEKELGAKEAAFASTQTELTDRWSRDFTVASLKPLTPEQLCWTVFRVTGVYDRYWATEAAELEKSNPLTEDQQKDSAQVAARQVAIEQRTFDKLKGNIPVFVQLYGAAAGQPQDNFFATADQALFAANGASISSWIAPTGDNVTERVIKQSDLQAAAEELYLTVLTRFPTEDESNRVAAYLAGRNEDIAAAAQELMWALLNSAEFRFNH